MLFILTLRQNYWANKILSLKKICDIYIYIYIYICVRFVRANARVYIRGHYVSRCVYQDALMRRSTPKHACLQIVLIYIYICICICICICVYIYIYIYIFTSSFLYFLYTVAPRETAQVWNLFRKNNEVQHTGGNWQAFPGPSCSTCEGRQNICFCE